MRHRRPRIGLRHGAVQEDRRTASAGRNGRQAGYEAAFGLLDHATEDLDAALADARELLALARSDRRALGLRHRGQPVLQPARAAPGALSPERRLPAAGRSAGRRRAADLRATAHLKRAFPRLAIVGSAYSYLQDWLPHVAQHNVRHGLADFVGLGRMVLSYPELPADVLGGRPLQRKHICRTFSDCTTGPRLGLVSGCYPLDDFYKAHPDAERLRELKAEP